MLSYLRVCGDSGEPNVEQTVWEINALQHKKNQPQNRQMSLNMLSKKTTR